MHTPLLPPDELMTDAEYDAERAKYEEDHEFCPKCHGEIYPRERTRTYKGEELHADCALELIFATRLELVEKVAKDARNAADALQVA